MNSLKLGDLTLDPRKLIYISSIRAVVCSGMGDLLFGKTPKESQFLLQPTIEAIKKYKADTLVNLGSVQGFENIRRFLPGKLKIQFVSKFVSNEVFSETQTKAEGFGCEVFKELLWSDYRFVDSSKEDNLDFPLFTISSSPHYTIRLGKGLFGGLDLEVFLRSARSLMLPSLKPEFKKHSVLSDSLSRNDVFAIGHHRVFPMGKVAEIRIYREKLGAVPITKTALQGKLTQRKPQIDLQR